MRTSYSFNYDQQSTGSERGTEMRKIILIVLFVSLTFSCGRNVNNTANGQENTNSGNAASGEETVEATVTGESGTLHEYLEDNAAFFRKYPERESGFDLGELDYFIDFKYKSNEYNKIAVKVAEEAKQNQMQIKGLGMLVSAIRTGAIVEIKKDALDEISAGRRKHLVSGQEIRIDMEQFY